MDTKTADAAQHPRPDLTENAERAIEQGAMDSTEALESGEVEALHGAVLGLKIRVTSAADVTACSTICVAVTWPGNQAQG
ncbi:hypothetical protein [Bradyrhizobium sp. AUGA SZCCT0042]|uniref:hypothetical protein n=1 Tax=Bradyrhizobium sp. AUGA SZCCT0042 TaxID=2807651 RepID=UPI001BAD672A|nr:hypothetical protein [Bradyrhizobium sp. AUGA SZCCT0042]MBR1301744.1 hypothetical protein [Bradyrhizobium sp. AUGA SZCCT0042]